jgi:hypothetical protein
MKSFPYPSADRALTPKLVRDALRRMSWEKLSWWSCQDDAVRETISKGRAYLWELTIADVAAPKSWFLVVALWNSSRMTTIRESFDKDDPCGETSVLALDIFANLFVIHLLSPGSPVQRLRAFSKLVTIERTEAQERVRERDLGREATTQAAARNLVLSARRSGDRVVFDAKCLLTSLLAHKAEYVRIRCGALVATVKRVKLDAVARLLVNMPILTTELAPIPREPEQAYLSIRWSRGNGLFGGLNLLVDEVIHDSWCTVVEIPTDVPKEGEEPTGHDGPCVQSTRPRPRTHAAVA